MKEMEGSKIVQISRPNYEIVEFKYSNRICMNEFTYHRHNADWWVQESRESETEMRLIEVKDKDYRQELETLYQDYLKTLQ